jgi:hypothetical protein
LYIKKKEDYGLLFTDDLFSMNIFKKIGNIENHINKYLRKIESWLVKWRLKIAPHKCNFLIFSKNSVSESSKLDLRLFGEKLRVKESPIFLGIRFDRHLTFKNRIIFARLLRK